MELSAIIDTIYPIPRTSKPRFLDAFEEVSFPKNHMLFQSGKLESKVYLIKRGLVRAYTFQDGQETTFWFGKEGEPILSMRSYVQNEKGYENVTLVEDSELFVIKSDVLNKLFNEDLHIANWGRKLAEQELIKTEERIVSSQFKTASERYRELLEKSPELIQRVQLGHIASYLGITQVSLSRIRSEIR